MVVLEQGISKRCRLLEFEARGAGGLSALLELMLLHLLSPLPLRAIQQNLHVLQLLIHLHLQLYPRRLLGRVETEPRQGRIPVRRSTDPAHRKSAAEHARSDGIRIEVRLRGEVVKHRHGHVARGRIPGELLAELERVQRCVYRGCRREHGGRGLQEEERAVQREELVELVVVRGHGGVGGLVRCGGGAEGGGEVFDGF